MPCFSFYPILLPSRFFVTSYEAIPAHLWELVARLFLPVLRLSHLIPFCQVGFLRRCIGYAIIAKTAASRYNIGLFGRLAQLVRALR
jgi:hypothetical protein